MRKALLLLSALAVFLLSSCGRNQYRIHGRVTSNELEDIQVFLVPLGQEDAAHVDSVHIHDHAFSFKGKEHRMCEIRLAKYHRDKGQNLLVVTEPGDIYVTIGPDSRGGGTPMNDSLQVWKDLTIKNNQERNHWANAGRGDLADSARDAYRDRTRQLALAVGQDSPLGEFLLNMYPLPKE